MNWRRSCLLLAAILIVTAAQWVLNYREVHLIQYADRQDGSGVALLHFTPNQDAQWIAWDAGMTNRRVIYRSPRLLDKQRQVLGIDNDGQRMAIVDRQHLIGIDVKSGQVIWRTNHEANQFNTKRIDFINDGKYIILSLQDAQTTGDGIVIVNAKTGCVVANSLIENVSRYLVQNNRLAVQYGRMHERPTRWDTWELDDDQLRLIRSSDFIPNQMMPIVNENNLEVSMIVSYMDRSEDQKRLYAKHLPTVLFRPAANFKPPFLFSGQGSDQHWLRLNPLGYGETIVLLVLVALATATWAVFLVSEDYRRDWPWRPVIDAAILLAMLIAMSVPVSAIVDPSTAVDHAPMMFTSGDHVYVFFDGVIRCLLIAVVVVSCLMALMANPRPRYIWLAFLAACAYPMLLPPFAFVVTALKIGYRFRRAGIEQDLKQLRNADSPTSLQSNAGRRKWRFGIREVMLLTTGIAMLIAMGTISAWSVAGGCMLVVLLALSIAITDRSIVMSSFFLSVFFTSLYVAGHLIWPQTTIAVFGSAVPMLLTLAGVFGYRMQRSSRDVMLAG